MNDLIAPIEAPAAVVDEFRRGAQAHVAMAALRQERINAASRRLENSSKLMEGVGQLEYRIDPDLYWAFRHTYGPDCWNDPDFRLALEKAGVIQKVKGISDKIIIQRRPGSDLNRIKYSSKTKGVIVDGEYRKLCDVAADELSMPVAAAA